MNEDLLKDVCVIIRSSGERTEDLCRYSILQNGIKEEQISIIKNISPFSEVLKEGYKKAVTLDKEYVFFIDADMVLLPTILEKMTLEIKRSPGNVFFVNPLVYDYLTGLVHPGGPHLYKIKCLDEAIDLIPNEEVSRRPETYVVKQMVKKGYNTVYLNTPSAIHEFEQYYKDVFNRSFNKFIKFPEKRWEMFKKFKKLKIDNKDFEVAYRAFKHASVRRDKLKLDNKQFSLAFKKMNIKEKGIINKTDIPIVYQALCEKIEKNKNSYFMNGYDDDLSNKKRNKISLLQRLIERLRIYISFSLFK